MRSRSEGMLNVHYDPSFDEFLSRYHKKAEPTIDKLIVSQDLPAGSEQTILKEGKLYSHSSSFWVVLKPDLLEYYKNQNVKLNFKYFINFVKIGPKTCWRDSVNQRL